MKFIKSFIICTLAGVIGISAPAISYAETNINNVMNRVVHSEEFMNLQEGVTESILGRRFSDTSEDGDISISYEGEDRDNDTFVDGEGNIILNNEEIKQDDITAQQKELLDYFQNMLKNSERGSTYFNPIETDQYGDWFDNMLAMSGSKEKAWVDSMRESIDINSNAYTLPNVADVDSLYQTYAKNLAITKDKWYEIMSKFAKSGSLGFGDNTWTQGGGNITPTPRINLNRNFDTSAPEEYDPDKMTDEWRKKYEDLVARLSKQFEINPMSTEALNLLAKLVPYNRPWWEWVLEFGKAIGKSAHAVFQAGRYQESKADKDLDKAQRDLNRRYAEVQTSASKKRQSLSEFYNYLSTQQQYFLNQFADYERQYEEGVGELINNNDLSDEEKIALQIQIDNFRNGAAQNYASLYESITNELKNNYENEFRERQFQYQALLDAMTKDWYNDDGSEKGLEPGSLIDEIAWTIEDIIDYYLEYGDPLKDIYTEVVGTGESDPLVQTLDKITGADDYQSWGDYWSGVGKYWSEDFTSAMENIWMNDFLNPQKVSANAVTGLPPKDQATPDGLKDKFNNATNEMKDKFNQYKDAYNNKMKAVEEATNARANGDSEMEAAWNQNAAEWDAIAQALLDELYNSIGYDNFDIPEEYKDIVKEIYANMDEDYRLQAISLEKEMLAIANKLKEKKAEYVNKDEFDKRMNALFGDKNVTMFDYNSFLNDYNKVHSKMSNVGSLYSPISFNYFNDASGWSDYKNYIDRLLFGDQYGIKEAGGLNSFYDNGNMVLTVMKEKVLRQVTENVTYYGHFNDDFLWRIEDSKGKEVGVYETNEPSVYVTGGSPDKYHVTENQKADVSLVTARVYGVRYYVFDPITNTVLASWEEKEVKITPQPNTASTRWVKVWTGTYVTFKSKSKGVKRNSDLWDTQQIQ